MYGLCTFHMRLPSGAIVSNIPYFIIFGGWAQLVGEGKLTGFGNQEKLLCFFWAFIIV